MTAIDAAQFEVLVSKASAWVTAEEHRVLNLGAPLTVSQIADAAAVGIKWPERVRLLQEAAIKLPADPILAEMASRLGMSETATSGRAHRYGIAICIDHWENRETIVHELVHTRQYEILGSIENFLRPYLAELLPPFRYPNGPLEREARSVAAAICRK